MSQGYTSKFIERVKTAEQTKLGVIMGNVCIAGGIPVAEVAEFFGVTRVTVYNWFAGVFIMPERHHVKANKLIAKFTT